jgi:hypothetical protein
MELYTLADAALYAVKLGGKGGCARYAPSMETQFRSQLGFTPHDIARNIPGGILVHRQGDDDAGHADVIKQHGIGAAGDRFNGDLHFIKTVFRQSAAVVVIAQLLDGFIRLRRAAVRGVALFAVLSFASQKIGRDLLALLLLFIGYGKEIHKLPPAGE